MGRIDLGIAPSDTTGNTVYASIADATTGSDTNLGVFVTTNGGTSWTQTTAPDICQHQCWYDNVIKVDPANKSIAFFGGSAVRDSSGNYSWVVRTENGGKSWSSVIPNLPAGSSGLPHVDNHAIAFVKLSTGKVRMYLGNDGGIWRTDDAEASTITWTNLNNPSLTLTQFYPSISINPSSPSIAFGGTQDNGSQNYQGGTNWVDNQLCGDGASTAVDTISSKHRIHRLRDRCPDQRLLSEWSGRNLFSCRQRHQSFQDSSSFIPPLVTDPNTRKCSLFRNRQGLPVCGRGEHLDSHFWQLVSGTELGSPALRSSPAIPALFMPVRITVRYCVSQNCLATRTYSDLINFNQ